MRKPAAWMLLLLLLLTACSRAKGPAPEPAPQPTPAPPPAVEQPAPAPLPPGPDLMAVDSPYELSLPELEQGLLRYLSRGDGSIADRLNRLYDHWGLRPLDEYVRLVEADLDGDGTAEVVTALNGGGGLTGSGALFVIHRRDGAPAIDRSETVLPGVRLFGVADLAPAQGPELIWSSTQAGAHTPTTRVIVSHWEPGRVTDLPGGEMETSFARLQVAGGDLLLTGGTVGSAGAGLAQRARTDRYRWTDGAFRLVDRRFAGSDLAYHRLLDGILALSYQREAEAERAFAEAMDPSRPALRADMVPPESMEGFTEAVRTFARLRLGALRFTQGRPDEARQVLTAATGPFRGLAEALASTGDCQAAQEWARQNPAFLEALNSPYGYANPIFQPEDLCGPLPPLFS
ncbi:MAG: hypothetical protein ACOY93_04890 [Bacillota bacterium]